MRAHPVASLLVATLLVSTVLHGATWNVAQTGCSDTTCAPCCTIQAAVERSSGGDVISVAPGTYPEQVDIRDMAVVGDITIQTAGGPHTVLVSPASGRALTHAGFDTNTVAITGVDFTSPDMSCVFVAHSGAVVLTDVAASGCGNHGFEIDATGTVSLERCAGTGNGNKGIQVDGAASVSLVDCTGSGNTAAGIHVLNVTGPVDLAGPTAIGNGDYGIGFDVYGPLTIAGATVTNNGTVGIWPWASGTVSISSSTITANDRLGIDLEGLDGVPVAGVTVTDCDVSGNGFATNDSGFRLRDVAGPVVIANTSFDDNAFDGFSPETSVVGDLEIIGGHANGNGDDGYDVRVVGDVTITGAAASNNAEYGFTTDVPGIVKISASTANDNLAGSGFNIFWQDPDPLDAVAISDCTATGNDGSGIMISHVAGPVSVVGATTGGNAGAGVRVDNAAGAVLVRDAVATGNLGSGIETRVEGGPVVVLDSTSSANNESGLDITSPGVPIAGLQVRRTALTDNLSGGLSLNGLGGPGPFKLTCNDVVGNATGLYLGEPITVDARWVWWGDVTGPSGQGPGAGDAIFAEPGGTVEFQPWLIRSIASPLSLCDVFGSGFESGLLEEWDAVVP